jgi:hypothetical protein
MTAQFARDLEDHKLVSPRREPALAPEFVYSAGDEEYSVRGGLVSEILDLGSSDLPAGIAPPDLASGHAQ